MLTVAYFLPLTNRDTAVLQAGAQPSPHEQLKPSQFKSLLEGIWEVWALKNVSSTLVKLCYKELRQFSTSFRVNELRSFINVFQHIYSEAAFTHVYVDSNKLRTNRTNQSTGCVPRLHRAPVHLKTFSASSHQQNSTETLRAGCQLIAELLQLCSPNSGVFQVKVL